MKCEDASRLASNAGDRRLDFRERWGLRLHLWICGNCRRFERQIRLLRRALAMPRGSAEPGGLGGALSPEARERIVRRLLAARDRHGN